METRIITGTCTRTPETMKKYFDIAEKRKANPERYRPFSPYEREVIQEFTHWFIIDNDFPYDAIATVNHMIFTKRKVPFTWELLTDEEREELELLKRTYISDRYDVLYENLPSGQTKPGHFHLHLLVLKRFELTAG
ncbi:hypothetical protein H6776_00630 [Candidatus Nomurabacteria bacterium]|nr:hypothetical protein [Candidatus Nomurabacteria bacterium]